MVLHMKTLDILQGHAKALAEGIESWGARGYAIGKCLRPGGMIRARGGQSLLLRRAHAHAKSKGGRSNRLLMSGRGKHASRNDLEQNLNLILLS